MLQTCLYSRIWTIVLRFPFTMLPHGQGRVTHQRASGVALKAGALTHLICITKFMFGLVVQCS
jgi:hypothetical protein